MGKFDGYLFCTDIDGTLTHIVDEKVEISPENTKAINYFVENGGKFTVSTGRLPEYILSLNAPINAPIICVNGAMIYDKESKTVLRESVVTGDYYSALKFAKDFEDTEQIVVSAADDGWFCCGKNDDLSVFDNIYRPLRFYIENKTVDKAVVLENELIKKFGDKYAFSRSWQKGIELVDKQGEKGAAALFLKEKLNCHTLIGAGDFENDKSLITVAEKGCAMDNGIDEIKRVADFVVPNADGTGIAYIINNIL